VYVSRVLAVDRVALVTRELPSFRRFGASLSELSTDDSDSGGGPRTRDPLRGGGRGALKRPLRRAGRDLLADLVALEFPSSSSSDKFSCEMSTKPFCWGRRELTDLVETIFTSESDASEASDDPEVPDVCDFRL